MKPSEWIFLRLALSATITLVGLVIIGRSLWFVATHHLAAGALIQPLIVGGLMVVLGLNRWRLWRAIHRSRTAASRRRAGGAGTT